MYAVKNNKNQRVGFLIHKINNNNLYIALDTAGASLRSLCDLHGTEYLWQGTKNGFNLGLPISFGTADNILSSNFSLTNKTSTSLTLNYNDTENDLSLKVFYELMENTLSISLFAENLSDTLNEYTLGLKPCFFVPIDEGDSFDDYVIKTKTQIKTLKDFKENITELKLEENALSLYSIESGKGINVSYEGFSECSVLSIKTDELLCITLKQCDTLLEGETKEHSIKISII